MPPYIVINGWTKRIHHNWKNYNIRICTNKCTPSIFASNPRCVSQNKSEHKKIVVFFCIHFRHKKMCLVHICVQSTDNISNEINKKNEIINQYFLYVPIAIGRHHTATTIYTIYRCCRYRSPFSLRCFFHSCVSSANIRYIRIKFNFPLCVYFFSLCFVIFFSAVPCSSNGAYDFYFLYVDNFFPFHKTYAVGVECYLYVCFFFIVDNFLFR